jgi:mannosyltransferase
MLLLAALSLYQLGTLSLWRDEVASVVFAKGSLGELLTIVGRDRQAVGLANMATYYLLLHFWLSLGEVEGTIRLLSVIFGVATVVPVYAVARRLLGWIGAMLATGILVLIPFVIHYNQEARGYSLAMLIAASMTWLLLIGVERRDKVWPWLVYGLIAAAGLYVHFFVALVVAAHGLWVLASRQVPPLLGALAAAIPIAVAAAPIPLIILQFPAEQEWIPPLSLDQVATHLAALAGGPWLLLALGGSVALAFILRGSDPLVWLLGGCVLVTVLGAMAISVIKPMFVGRYLIIILPHVAILAAVAICSLRRPVLQAAAGIALGGLLVLALPRAYADTHQQYWQEAVQWMAPMTQPGDRMIAGNARRPLEYYLGRVGDDAIPQPTRSALLMAEAPHGRLWVAMTGPVENTDLLSELAGSWTIELQRAFGARLRIYLMTPRVEPGTAS